MTRRPRVVVPLSVAPVVPFHEPDLVPEHKEAVIAAVRWAWAELRRIDPDILRDGTEASVTAKLESLLNDRANGVRRIPWLRDFETVTRDASQTAADGRLEKKPDLTFRPLPYASVTNTTQWAWFVECKIVDGGSTVSDYRDKGVHRFSSGEYAALMPSGAMLAYVRDGSKPGTTLGRALKGRVGTMRHHSGPSESDDRSESQHDRSQLSNPCVDVTLTHLWLPACSK